VILLLESRQSEMNYLLEMNKQKIDYNVFSISMKDRIYNLKNILPSISISILNICDLA